MTKARHDGRRKASVLGKARAGRSASVMKPEYLAEIERFRLMDDTFMSKCLENAPECSNAAEMYFDILKRQVSQFKNSEEGRHYMCEAMERIAERREAIGEARGKREGKRETMIATAKRLLANGKLMLKEIAECTGLSLVQVKKLRPSMA